MQDIPLIPRALLFGNAARKSVNISPDGERLAWIEPVEGIDNIWCAPRDDMAAGQPVTSAKHRGITHFFWAQDSRHLLFHEDELGDEEWQLHAVDCHTQERRALTAKGSRGLFVGSSHAHPSLVLAKTFQRDPRFGDLEVIDLATGKRTVVEENSDGFSGYLLDDDFKSVFALQRPLDGRLLVFRQADSRTWQPFLTFEMEDAQTSGLVRLSSDARTLFMLDSRGRDTTALVALDLMTGEQTIVAADERADIEGYIEDLETHEPVGYAINAGRRETIALKPPFAEWVRQLDAANLGDWRISSRSQDNRWWIVEDGLSTRPGRSYLFDSVAGTLEFLNDDRPELAGFTLAEMATTTITSSDGLKLICYVTLPHGLRLDTYCADGQGLPTVLLVHGGPHARDTWGYNSGHQWLANRGYCVISVNFRSSLGFGKSFLAAGDGEWGRAMDRDLEECVDWLVARGVADPERLAIMGASYGGYAVLSALTQRPERYACGIDMVGPSNLETLLGSIPPHWEATKATFYRALGDPATEEGRALLRERSPLHRAAEIKAPLLIAQGERDPRVKVTESDQMAAAMQAHGIPVIYIKFPEEGHGFGQPANEMAFNGIIEMFLSHWIGGRFEPQTEAELSDANFTVAAGDETLRDLRHAPKTR